MSENELLKVAMQATMNGAQVALGYYGRQLHIEKKADETPVSLADTETERAIISALRPADPGIGIFSEERGKQGPQDRRWIIDPIDATKNFLRGIPVWAVMIALEVEKRVVLGVVYNPVTRELWAARAGHGAWFNGVPIRVSNVSRVSNALFLHSSLKVLMKSLLWPRIQKLASLSRRTRGPGDFSGYMMVAQGQGDIYLEASGLMPYDLAAPSIIVTEAGGNFTDIGGQRTIYSGSALATNDMLHCEVLEILRSS